MVDIGKNQVSRLVRQTAAKIFDVNCGDTTARVCSLAGIVPPNAVALVLTISRASGTGTLAFYHNTGTVAVDTVTGRGAVLMIAYPDLKYSQSVANDDFDVYLHGYFVEGPVGGE